MSELRQTSWPPSTPTSSAASAGALERAFRPRGLGAGATGFASRAGRVRFGTVASVSNAQLGTARSVLRYWSSPSGSTAPLATICRSRRRARQASR
ncbi:MAG: hypothetical protein KC620_24270 [Myxococcales bacterium]|nr:hypothetical protein [Myxococcales bacterium]